MISKIKKGTKRATYLSILFLILYLIYSMVIMINNNKMDIAKYLLNKNEIYFTDFKYKSLKDKKKLIKIQNFNYKNMVFAKKISITYTYNYQKQLINIDKIYIDIKNNKNIQDLYKKNLSVSKSNEKNQSITDSSIYKILNIFVRKINIKTIYSSINIKNKILSTPINYNAIIKNINVNLNEKSIMLSDEIKISSIVEAEGIATQVSVNISKNLKTFVNINNKFTNLKLKISKNKIIGSGFVNFFVKKQNYSNVEYNILQNNFNYNFEYNIKNKNMELIHIYNKNTKDKNYILSNLDMYIKDFSILKENIGNIKVELNLLGNKLELNGKHTNFKNINLQSKKRDIEIKIKNYNKITITPNKLLIKKIDFLDLNNITLDGLLKYDIKEKKNINDIKITIPNISFNQKQMDRFITTDSKNYSDIIKDKKEKDNNVNSIISLTNLNIDITKLNITNIKTKKVSIKGSYNINKYSINKMFKIIIEKGKYEFKKHSSININNSTIKIVNDVKSLNINFEKNVVDRKLVISGTISGILSNPKIEISSTNPNLTKEENILLLIGDTDTFQALKKIKIRKKIKEISGATKSGIFLFNLLKKDLVNVIGIELDKLELDTKTNNFTNEEELNLKIEKKINKKIIVKYEQTGDNFNSYGVEYKLNNNYGISIEHETDIDKENTTLYLNYEN